MAGLRAGRGRRVRHPAPRRPKQGQTRERTTVGPPVRFGRRQPRAVRIEVTLSNPYTFRATTLANVTSLLAAVALVALG